VTKGRPKTARKAHASVDGQAAQPDARTQHEKLEEVLAWAFGGDGTIFFPKDIPVLYLEAVAKTQDEPRQSELLARLYLDGSSVVTKFLRKLTLCLARTSNCNDVSELGLEAIPLCALEALGLLPSEAHDQFKSFEKRGEHLREDPRRYKPRNGRPGPGNPRVRHLAEFVTELCQWDEHGTVSSQAFHAAYKAFCSQLTLLEIGGEPFTAKALTVEILKSMGVSKCRLTVEGKKAAGLRGIILRQK